MILHLYFARRFANWFGIVFVGLFALIALVDLVDQTRRFADRGVSAGGIFELVILNTPETVNQILPLIVLIATVAFFTSLARSSELVATRAVGRSALGALVAPVGVVLVLGTLATTMLNPIVAGTSKKYSELAQGYRTGGASTFSISTEGLWLRQSTEEGQMVIGALRSNPDASVLYDVTFLEYEETGTPFRRIRADSAELQAGEWLLRNAKEWPLARGTNAEGNATLHDRLAIPSTLTVEHIRESFGRPNTISIWDLPDFIRQLDQAGFSSLQHRVWFQSEIARPLFLVAMVLVASAFTMRHTRFGGTGLSVLAAVLLGFALYFVRSFAMILGENGQLPVYLAAWAPPVASVLLAFGPLLHAEDG
ncbi:LPS export ABC transporter permease LptG [Roseobacter weihaiensis]|uniref:LPS export ABC transporter permease LptG n=1 Tax=Roseobacter weihaiensis TaxID=2763262 RepID=UPI001D09FD52|nr:LPS export ABC transporter permease LptG [Roseobacter sp. H9]